METIKAYVNHGQWNWRCPECGGANAVERSVIDGVGVCGHPTCFPQSLAMANSIKPGQENMLSKLLEGDASIASRIKFVPVADLEERQNARSHAAEQGQAYQIEIPDKKGREQVMKLLRPRPRNAMNYHPENGETIADLERENKDGWD